MPASEDTPLDAIELLTDDHEDVRQMFAEYEELIADSAEDDERQLLATQICNALTAHATAEEELLYPAARTVVGEDELLDDAEAEHQQVRDLIQTLQGLDPSDERFDSTLRVLSETVEHHVQEEEGELFPRLQESGLDLQDLGERIADRKEEVLAALEDEDAG